MILKYDDNDDKTKQVKTSKTVEKKLNKKQASSNSSTLCLLSDNSENTYSLVVHENNNKSNASKKSCDEIIQKRKNNQGQYNKHNSMDHFPRKNKSSTIVQDKDNDEDDDDDEDKEWEEWERSWTKLKKWLHQKKVQRKKMKNDYKNGKAYKNHNIKQKFNQSNNNNNNDNVNHEDEKNQILFSDRLQLFMIKLSKYKTISNIDHDNIDNLISFEDIPWPEDHESILCISNSDSKLEKKKKLRMGLIFWHPDHFKSILNQIHKVRVQYKQSRMFNNNNNNNNDNSNNIKSLNASLQEDAHGQNDDDELMHLYMEKAHEVTRRIIIEKKKEFS
jgi:hypothetical protein